MLGIFLCSYILRALNLCTQPLKFVAQIVLLNPKNIANLLYLLLKQLIFT